MEFCYSQIHCPVHSVGMTTGVVLREPAGRSSSLAFIKGKVLCGEWSEACWLTRSLLAEATGRLEVMDRGTSEEPGVVS